jgi:3,4-dihydroxy 2-butanone 4-phosphate synthase / GTP cyclohydrolase II
MQDFQVLHPDPIHRVELALDDMRQGKMVILIDDEDRENEGDLVVAAEKVTPGSINFMAKYGRGLICLSLTAEQVERLALPMMAINNQSAYQTAFTVSIEAREGVSTGISAADRSLTVQVAINPKATPRDVVVPGHMFPLQARTGGVLQRVGQTEGSVDLARLAGLNPSGVICEIMNDDGTMSRLPQLMEFGAEHCIRIVSVADIIKYRMRTERVVQRVSEGELEIPDLGAWRIRLYRSTTNPGLHMAIYKGPLHTQPTLTRVQSAPLAWATLNPSSSSWGSAALKALSRINEEGRGALVFMHLRGGSLDAIRAAFARDFEGTNERAVQPQADALRDLGTGCQILVDLGLKGIRLLSSNKRPIVGLEAYGLELVERVPL